MTIPLIFLLLAYRLKMIRSNIATWNVRTFQTPSAREEAVCLMQRHQILVLALTETHERQFVATELAEGLNY